MFLESTVFNVIAALISVSGIATLPKSSVINFTEPSKSLSPLIESINAVVPPAMNRLSILKTEESLVANTTGPPPFSMKSIPKPAPPNPSEG